MPTFESNDLARPGTVFLEKETASDLYYKDPLIRRVVLELKCRGYLSRQDEPGIRLALDEALMNAILHGNRADPRKKVRLRVFGDESTWGVEIEDEGEGMKPQRVPAPPSQSARPYSGRGLLILEKEFSQVVFLGRGNVLRLVRGRSEADAEAEREGRQDAPLQPTGLPRWMMPASRVSDPDRAFEVPVKDDEKSWLRPVAGPVVHSTELVRAVRTRGAIVAEILAAKLDDSNVEYLARQISELAAGENVVVLDFRRVGYLSSVVIGRLVWFADELRNRGASVRLASVASWILDLLDLMGVRDAFAIHPDPEAATEDGP